MENTLSAVYEYLYIQLEINVGFLRLVDTWRVSRKDRVTVFSIVKLIPEKYYKTDNKSRTYLIFLESS